MIDHHSLTAQFGPQATLRVKAALQHNALDEVTKCHVGLTGLVFGTVAVEARPAAIARTELECAGGTLC